MRAKKNIIASYLYIIVNIFINLFIVRLTVQFYGDDIYAFVVLAFSFITYVETFNFGTFISNRTQIPLRGENASVYTVATIKLLFKISISLAIAWSIFYLFAGDFFISLVSSETDKSILETGKTLINTGVLYGLIKIPLTVVLSGFAGHDRVDIEKKYNGIQQLTKFVCLFICTKLSLSVEHYMISFSILGILILFGANFHYYKDYISHKKSAFLKHSKRISSFYITKKSFKFYIMTITSVIVWSTDNLIVSIFFNPKMVTDYSINFAIYNAGFLFITAIAGALIANYGNLIRDKDFEKLNFRINLSIYSTFVLASMICFGGVLFSKEIIELWVGKGHHINNNLILAFGLFGITIGMTSVMNTVLSLFANTKTLTLMAAGEALLNIFLSIILLKIIDVEGVAYATSIAALLTMVIPGVLILGKSFERRIKIKLFPLLINLMFVLSFTFLAEVKTFIFLEKVVLFIGYVIGVLIFSIIFENEYFKSLKKIILKRN